MSLVYLKLLRPLMFLLLLIMASILAFKLAPQPKESIKAPITATPPVLAATTAVNPTFPDFSKVESPSNPYLTAAPVLTPTTPSTLPPGYLPTIESPEDLRLVLNESFEGPNLNTDLWNSQFRWGTANPPELEDYTLDSLSIQSGNLSITADKNINGNQPYSSGMIASFNRFYFQYGYIEIRARVPKGQGLWPGLWLMAQNSQSAEEIDIMELLGQEPSTVYTTIHYKLANMDKGMEGSSIHGPDFSKDFHIYAVDWEWDKIVWYIDDSEVFRVTDHISHEPMYLIANLAVGGLWPGNPDQDTSFPAHFNIDYIRVFTH